MCNIFLSKKYSVEHVVSTYSRYEKRILGIKYNKHHDALKCHPVLREGREVKGVHGSLIVDM